MQIENPEKQENKDDAPQLGPEQATTCDVTSPITSSCQKGSMLCGGCDKVVEDASFLQVENRYWHVTCLKCCACAVSLSEDPTCFIRNGNIYCRQDYHTLFVSRTCERCGVMISADEFVMRVHDRVYHAMGHCFCCCKCERPLVTGERFVEITGNLFCSKCFQPLFYSNDLREVTLNKSGRPKKRKQPMTSQRSISHLPITINFDEGAVLMDPANSLHTSTQFNLHGAHERQGCEQQKSKRLRTSFKHHQLSAMKAYFDTNHNPDAKDLKQLEHETKLSKRVLQVWFQNARAKFRRTCLQSEEKNGVHTKNTKTVLEDRKSDSCLDLSCSDSFSPVFGVSPISDSTSDGNRNFFENPDSDPMTSYSDYQRSESLEEQLLENADCPLTPLHASSSTPTSSLTSKT